MQSTNRPAKFLVPFAQNDSARVELPASTSDTTRASQSLGFPPATGLPPEAGGVPPQLEDMNGGLNQIARGVWWALGGGRYPYDNAWANDTLIGGYARGAVVPAALGAGQIGIGDWYNNTESNAANPDTDGTGWVPGYHYGATALTGQTGGTVTLTPAQSAKRVLTIAGTLTNNLVLVVPTWVYDWTIYNNTSGAFTVTVKNASTPGAVIPQNGAPTPVRCDGSACSLVGANIAPANSSTQALQLGQATGRLLRVSVYGRSSGTQQVSVDGAPTTTAGASTFTALAATNRLYVKVLGGGGGGGGSSPTGTNVVSVGGGGGAGALAEFTVLSGFQGANLPVTVGAGGAGGTDSTSGATGGTSSLGNFCSCAGGTGGFGQNQISPPFTAAGGGGGTVSGTANFFGVSGPGAAGGYGLALANNIIVGGAGAVAPTSGGVGGYPALTTSNGFGGGSGSGGSGAATAAGRPNTVGTGGTGGSGVVIIEEYA